MSSFLNCPLCNFISPNRNLWLSHIRGVHSNDDDFSMVCGISECTATYSKCSSFISHVYRKHRDVLSVPDKVEHSTCSSEHTDSVVFERSVDMEHTISQILGTDALLQQKKSALHVLNLKEVHGLSEIAVQHVIHETQSIFSHTVHRIKAGVSEHLSRSGIEAPSSLYDMFSDIDDPFKGLHTSYLQEKFYRENLDCIVS